MQERLNGNKYWISALCVDSYENGVLKGKIHNPFYEEAQSFESLTQFLTIMECTLDLTKLPQSFTAARSFTESRGYEFKKAGAEKCERGRLATFSLCIRFRQNSSWQGSLHWLEEGNRQNFRSALEMIFLMDSALQKVLRRQEKEENTA